MLIRRLIMRKRIRYTTFFLMLIFCIIPIVCMLMFPHLNLTDVLTKMGGDGFGDEVSMVKVEGTTDGAALIRAAESEEVRSALYYEVENDREILRYIYFNKDYVHLPMVGELQMAVRETPSPVTTSSVEISLPMNRRALLMKPQVGRLSIFSKS